MEKTASVATDPAAPADERRDAGTQLAKSAMPRALSDLIPRNDIQPFIDFVQGQIEEQQFSKALQYANVIPFPSKAVEERREGMQSVFVDDMQVNVNGDFIERPGNFSADMMRSMVEQTPILNAIVMTRIRQIQRYCRPSQPDKPGFSVRLKDDDAHPTKAEQESIQLLNGFFTHCGWETRPRQRQRLKRDSFPNLMAKLVRDSLTMDSAPIETEFKRDTSKGIDGLYAIDGATIRLCSEEGYQGEDEIFALQVVQGRIRTTYSYNDLILVPRNPRSDVLVGGYGLGEPELLIRVVTGFLNAFTYNTKFFDSNAIPKGLLHLTGNYSDQDIASFKRYWNAMVKGVNNAWSLPVMISKDQESKATYEKLGAESNELMFGKWMTFLASIACAIYCIGPDEINFESFSAGNSSSLRGNDTEEKITNSKDKGLVPLLSYFGDLFSDYIVSDFADKFEFGWNGLDDEDKKQAFEEIKLCNTVNELRAARDEEPIEDAWGDAPLNPSLLSAWQAEQQQGMQDFGDPSQMPDGQPGQEEGDGFGSPDEPGAPPDDGEPVPPGGEEDDGAAPAPDMGKAFGLPPIYSATDI